MGPCGVGWIWAILDIKVLSGLQKAGELQSEVHSSQALSCSDGDSWGPGTPVLDWVEKAVSEGTRGLRGTAREQEWGKARWREERAVAAEVGSGQEVWAQRI